MTKMNICGQCWRRFFTAEALTDHLRKAHRRVDNMMRRARLSPPKAQGK